MKVYVKENREIPEGYVYSRSDRYTPEELLEACIREDGLNRRRTMDAWRQVVRDYMYRHPKSAYTMEDKTAVMRLLYAAKRSVAKKKTKVDA